MLDFDFAEVPNFDKLIALNPDFFDLEKQKNDATLAASIKKAKTKQKLILEFKDDAAKTAKIDIYVNFINSRKASL